MIFPRANCKLPDGLGLQQESFGNAWMLAENITSATLDTAVRRAG